MARAKVAHLTSVHPAFDIRIFHKECKTLSEAGFDVVLIAPHEKDETQNGLPIRSVPVPSTRRVRVTRTVWQVYKAALAEDAAIYHFHDPELIPVGLLLRMRGKHVIYDVHEDLPRQISSKHWIPTALRGMLSIASAATEHFCGSKFDAVIAATPQIAKRFPFRATTVVHNFPRDEEFLVQAMRPYHERELSISYVGGLTVTRGVRELVQAMSVLPQSLPVRLKLAGDISPPTLADELKFIPGWSRTDYLGWQSRSGIQELLSKTRVGLITLHPTRTYVESYPIKLFEYMAAGVPVIASDFPLWRDIVAGSDCGLMVNPMKPGAIAEAIEWMLNHPAQAEAMGLRGRQAVAAHYSWSREGKKLIDLYTRLFGAA